MLMATAACYTTRVHSALPPSGEEHSDRQWFMLGGLAPLSSAVGRECTQGIATSESRLSALDILINAGLFIGGGVAGAAVCSKSNDPAVYASCASAGASLLPFLLGSRTVSYTCASSQPRARLE
jgi:hypothetical protein